MLQSRFARGEWVWLKWVDLEIFGFGGLIVDGGVHGGSWFLMFGSRWLWALMCG